MIVCARYRDGEIAAVHLVYELDGVEHRVPATRTERGIEAPIPAGAVPKRFVETVSDYETATITLGVAL